MPPKPKYSKEQISQMAYEVVREKGLSKLSARELGKYMGTSPTPIFSVFDDMDEVYSIVLDKAVACFGNYISVPGDAPNGYEARLLQCLKFAEDEPQLFKALFLNDAKNSAGFGLGSKIVRQTLYDDIKMLAKVKKVTVECAKTRIVTAYTLAFAYGTLISLNQCYVTSEEARIRAKNVLDGVC